MSHEAIVATLLALAAYAMAPKAIAVKAEKATAALQAFGFARQTSATIASFLVLSESLGLDSKHSR
jgi:hypothetical protein